MDLSSEKVFDDDNDGSNTFTAGHGEGDKTVSALSNKVTPGGEKKKKPGNSKQVGNTWR